MAFQQQESEQDSPKDVAIDEEETEDTVSWSKEETEKAYNVFRTIIELINPEQSSIAAALVQACQELSASIQQKGNVEEAKGDTESQSVTNG